MADTRQQRAILRQCRSARIVRKRFPEGTRIVNRQSGMGAVVLRHVPGSNAQGGYLKVRWDNGVISRVGPINVKPEEDARIMLTAEQEATRDALVTASMPDMEGSDRAYWLGVANVVESYTEYVEDALLSGEEPESWMDWQVNLADRDPAWW